MTCSVRLLSFALAATSIAVLALAAPAAQAAPVSSGIVNLTIPNNSIGLYLNVVTGTTYTGPDVFPANTGPGSNYDLCFYGTTTWTTFAPNTSGQASTVPTTSKGFVAATTTGAILPLTTGTVVGGSSVFNTGSASPSGLVGIANALFGFRFRNENDPTNLTDDTVHYGWARVTLVNGVPGTLNEYGYESAPLTAIAAGVTAVTVPEAGTLPLLLGAGFAGSLAVAIRRRLRS